MKCVLCMKGKLSQSGCFMFCDTCGFVSFTVTADYLSAAGALLGALNSNVHYASEDAFVKGIQDAIADHLPGLNNWMNTVKVGANEMLEELCNNVIAQAINLQIDREVTNPTEPELTCCGDRSFSMVNESPFKLRCDHCDTVYVNNEDTDGKFEPHFKCSNCNNITYSLEEEGMVSCNGCGQLYMYMVGYDTFAVIT